MSSQIPGSGQPPISFPGIASGIDYNSIIQKLTALTLAPEVHLNAQVATLNAANAELIKINNLFASVQSALGALSDPSLFNSWTATSSNLGVLTASGIPSSTATPGTYIVNSVKVATATSVASNPLIGASERSNIAGGAYVGQPADSVPLANSYAAITPTNGSSSQGSITIDGVSVSYNVNTQSINAIFASINAAVQTVDPSFSIGFIGATDTVEIQGSKPVTLGSANDSGNLLQVLKLDQAPVNNGSGPPYTVVATSGVGGINAATSLSNTATNAGFTAPVTSGVFTINGVAISISATGDNLSSILNKINASNAGVNANYNSATNQITLTSKTTGPQSIVLGATGDTSNFLSLAGLTTASGATATTGQQAAVTLQKPDGTTQTVYSNSNSITNAIPGISLNLVSNDPSTPFSVVVGSNTSNLVNALNTFISTYNTTITEINNATTAPIVTPTQPGALPSTAAPSIGGGILYGNSDVTVIKAAVNNLVSGFLGSGTLYNSLSSIGLNLSSSFSVITTSNNGSNNGGSNTPGQGGVAQQTTYQGTDGTLQPLDATKLSAALQSNPNAVQALLQGANGLTTQLGTYLTGVTGFPTLLSTGTVGQIPTTSLIQNYENANTNIISSAQEQIKQITDEANLQANGLRAEFVGTETQLAGYQSLQSQLSGFFKQSGG